MGNPWLAHVKATMKKHKGLQFKAVLKMAKKTYKKAPGKKTSVKKATTAKGRKRGRKGRKKTSSKRRGRKRRGRKSRGGSAAEEVPLTSEVEAPTSDDTSV